MQTTQSSNEANLQGELIAPCGMNCALCLSYQFQEHDINQLGSIGSIAQGACRAEELPAYGRHM